MKETVKPCKLCELADTLEEQQKKEVDEMKLTQSNPGLSEEDLDGGDDDVMKVLPDENAKGVTNLEGDEEVVTMQDIDGFILSQPGGSQVHYMRGTYTLQTEDFGGTGDPTCVQLLDLNVPFSAVNDPTPTSYVVPSTPIAVRLSDPNPTLGTPYEPILALEWIHESHPNSSNPTAATNFDPTPILATTSDPIPIPATTVDSTPVPATTDPTPASYPHPTPHSHHDNIPTSANDCDPRATSSTSSDPSPSSSTFIMDLDVPAIAAKLRKRNQVVMEDDSWSDWYSSDSTEYVVEEVSCDSETSLDEENIVGAVDPNDKIYQGHLWMPRRDEKIKIRRWDMFTNKSHCMRVEASPAAYAWLMKKPKEHWARYLFDKLSASADNSTNFVENFNKVINTLREKSILNLLEGIRKFWPTFKWPLLDPPFVVKKRGPITKDRVRGPEEGRKRPTRSRTVRCSKCNGLYHNSLTCKGQGNKPSIRIKKRPAPSDGTGQKHRGRPRKQAPVSTVCQPSSTEPPSSKPASTQPSSSQPSLAQPSSIQPMLGN
ncbi:hypothetical protein Cgig2_029893 [Carnegiea gigantea]|uniref:Uncharacterized protein n=1 Tax=Carnegiea gigantea TaxID=171969 RepID=A0A9Q1QC31_9CARY|nr:hypothetical protein Cgig2_029893 [Carnegiea gigantea]